MLEFFETSTRNVLAAEEKKSVGHHVALSVAQEKLIKASPIPYTLVRTTQFFEFVGRIADEATNGQIVRLPSVLDSLPIQADKAASWQSRMLRLRENG